MSSASTWGDPSATKRVLLLHGTSASSLSWNRVAREFASRGYFVIAPDLLGHGNARRGTDYTIAALANELRPYFITERPYDIIVGHSLGALVAFGLYPLLTSTHPVHIVLSDPPLELTPESVNFYKAHVREIVSNVKSPEAYQQEMPQCTREDAVWTSLGAHMCDPAGADAIFDQNVPWSFSHYLLTAPENVRLTVLASDPAKGALIKEADIKAYPRVAFKTVWGVSHLLPMEAPLVVVETALQGDVSQN